MARIVRTKFTFPFSIFLLIFIFSCAKEINLDDDSLANGVVDDNFKIPFDEESILDVLSNDIYTTPNVRITEISNPSSGYVRINGDNTITYIPNAAYNYQDAIEVSNSTEITQGENTHEASSIEQPGEEAPANSTANQEGTANDGEGEGTTIEADQEENTAEEVDNEQNAEEVTSTNQMNAANNAVDEAISTAPNPVENTPVEVDNGQIEEEPTSTESNQEENSFDNQVDTSNSAEEEAASTETSQDESTSDEQVDITNGEEEEASLTETDQEESVSEVDSFTYTTETENEDGTTTTETATVTVEVESTPEEEQVPNVEETPSQIDYWRNPVISASRIMDEKYYDLDTGEIYPKEVNLQRGQVQNYIEHENCPQRIKDKWDNRIEITPTDVNGSENGLKDIFDAYPRGTLFYLRAGVYQDQKNAVLENDQDVVGEYGAILDGSGIEGNSVDATRAIRSMERGYICNIRVREYPTWNDPQNLRNPRGAALEVHQNGAILNCEVHSHNTAISVVYGSQAMWNKFTAGRLGIYGYGHHEADHAYRRGAIVKYNEWYGCNFNNYDQHHEAGGSKFVKTDGTIWSHNYIHDNPTGSGIWNDIDNRDSEIYNNVIINTYRSIFMEISYTANIHHNTIEYGTGFGAIYISNSQGNKVHHNLVRWSLNGISIRDVPKIGTSKLYPGQPYRGIDNEIYANHIWQQADNQGWTTGEATLFDGNIDPNNSSNQWHDNHYYIDDNAEGAALFSQEEPFMAVFMFAKNALPTNHHPISWEEWKVRAGEANSTLEYAKYF